MHSIAFKFLFLFGFQARPIEYAAELLDHQFIVSFHKHYLLDPMDVYKEYLQEDDV